MDIIEPSEQEIEYHIAGGLDGRGLTCPACEHNRTSFLRNGYHICHECRIWFRTEDALENEPKSVDDMTINVNRMDMEANMWEELAYQLGKANE